MEIDKNNIVTQEETGETAPIDEAGEKAKAELEKLEQEAGDTVREGLDATED